MAIASGSCPSCGAPIEFGLGSSIAKVCEYCRATVCRTDRGLEDLGRVAALADIPSLIAVGDVGTVDGRGIQVLGRVQLNHGKGPWDEYYVALDNGEAWGWLAYAEGHWLLTLPRPGLVPPPFAQLSLEQHISVHGARYLVTELRTGQVVSAEGELPAAIRPGQQRVYADLMGSDQAFATLDYGTNAPGSEQEVFTGWVIDEHKLKITQAGPRTQNKVTTDHLRCPSCGGDIAKLGGERTHRVGCPYCGAISDIALQQVIAKQEAALTSTDIPIGSRGTFDDIEYICLAFLRRSALFDGERFAWDEYLLFAPSVGFRWLVKDETSWMWAAPVNPAELDLSQLPQQVGFGQYTFQLRSTQRSRVDYVLGEVYWQVEIGETVDGRDYVSGTQVISREQAPGEVRWSYSSALPWPVIARAFGVSEQSAAGQFQGGGSRASLGSVIAVLAVLLLVLACCVIVSSPMVNSGTAGTGVIVFGGSGGYSGGK